MAFADTFKALSDPVRRDILTMLKNGRMSAGEIGSHFDMTGATVSYHLNILKKADLVFEEKEKNRLIRIGSFQWDPAASYSPGPSPAKYHRR